MGLSAADGDDGCGESTERDLHLVDLAMAAWIIDCVPVLVI